MNTEKEEVSPCNIQLIQGNCIEVMRDIPDKSVDMICCDLPFGLTENVWDTVIPFADLWESYHRIAKENAAIVLNCQQPFTTRLINSNLAEFKYCWIWNKKQCTGFLNSKKQPLRNYEEIAVFYRQQCTYNPQMRKGKKQVKGTGKLTTNYGGYDYMPHYSEIYYPTSILVIPQQRVKNGHPTQKPVPLYEYLIRTYTNKGMTVLDNCMGSGSSGIACKKLKRNYIGIELNEEWYNYAKSRIENA